MAEQSPDGWERADNTPENQISEPVVGVGPGGTFQIYRAAVEELFDTGTVPERGVVVEVRPDRGLLRVVFHPDEEPTHTLSGMYGRSMTILGPLKRLGVTIPETTQHFEYEWDEESETLTVDLSEIIED